MSELSESLPAGLGELLDARAKQHPRRLAWSFFEQGAELTYAALRDHVRRVGAAL